MEIQTRDVDNVVVIDLPSELAEAKREDLEHLRDFCRQIQDDGCRELVFNMGRLGTAPSMLLGTLIVIHKRLKTQEGRMAISEVSEALQKVLSITGIDHLIDTYDSEPEAVNSFGASD